MRKESKYFFLNFRNYFCFENQLFFCTVIYFKLKSRLKVLFHKVFYSSSTQSFDHFQESRYISSMFYFKTEICEIKCSLENFLFHVSRLEEAESKNLFYRFYWLENINGRSLNQYSVLFRDLNTKYGKNRFSDEWFPYNSSERINSILYFLIRKFEDQTQIRNTLKDIPDFELFLKNTELSILGRLELDQFDQPFNHTLNNYRGLVSVFVLLDDDANISKYLALFNETLLELTDNEGFFREGSSHYQLIFAKWLIELVLVISLFKRELLKDINISIFKSVIEVAIFFICNDKIPLFGDVSPDLSPRRSIEYIKDHLPLVEKLLNVKIDERTSFDGFHCFKSYSRINYHHWTLFVKHERNYMGKPHSNHSHDDQLSFVLFFKNDEQIIDPGRVNYRQTYKNDLFCQYGVHNSLCAMDQNVTKNFQLFPNIPSNVFDQEIYLTSEVLGDNAIIQIVQTPGRNKFALGDYIYFRKFILTKSSFEISDFFKSNRELDFSLNFCFTDKNIIDLAQAGKAGFGKIKKGYRSRFYSDEIECYQLSSNKVGSEFKTNLRISK